MDPRLLQLLQDETEYGNQQRLRVLLNNQEDNNRRLKMVTTWLYIWIGVAFVSWGGLASLML